MVEGGRGEIAGRRLRLLRRSDISPCLGPNIHIFTMSMASITSKEMRKLVCNKMCLLPINDLREVFKQAQKMIAPEKFIVAGDGTRISLDSSIGDDVISRLLEAIDAKLRE